MQAVKITHFSDVLCVWAYVGQIRCEELLVQLRDQVEIDYRFLHVFGAVRKKMDSQWADRGGLGGYAAHVKEIAAGFEHAAVHPDVWTRHTPESSMPAHLFLCAVRALENRGDAAAHSLGRAAQALRAAFFVDCRDISNRSALFEVADGIGLDVASIERVLTSGVAHAELAGDLDMAREYSVRASPTMVLNEGRQQLTGNVGYRVIEANVRELLASPHRQQSWC